VRAFSSTRFLGQAIRLPLRLIPKDAVVPVLSGPLRGAKWIVGAANHSSWLGIYERDKAWTFASLLTPNDVVYDIGAHVGYYSLIAAKAGAQVFAFEPLPRNLAYLDRHIAINQAAVRVIRAAVSDADGKASFVEGPYSEMGRLANKGTTQVTTIAIDSLKIPAPTIIKMDVEGGEGAALRGLRRTLDRYAPRIFLALHGRDCNAECIPFLRRLGYGITSIDGLPIESSKEVAAHCSTHPRPISTKPPSS
jgi:FkbM family methyltransferase